MHRCRAYKKIKGKGPAPYNRKKIVEREHTIYFFNTAKYGGAIYDCEENEDGELWVDNGEYASQVNYCPYCGYKAKAQVDMGAGCGK